MPSTYTSPKYPPTSKAGSISVAGTKQARKHFLQIIHVIQMTIQTPAEVRVMLVWKNLTTFLESFFF